MGTLEQGAYQAINNCLHVQDGETITLITDNETKIIAEAFTQQINKIPNTKLFTFYMEDFGQRPEDGSNPIKFPQEIGDAMQKSQVSIYAASAKKGELQSFRSPMTAIVDSNKLLRHAHMPKIDLTLMQTGMCSDYTKVQAISKKLAELAAKTKYIKVTNPAGCDFIVENNPEYKWQICDGNITAEHRSNLPGGEVFNCIYDMNGTVVIDGILGDYLSSKYGIIQDTPVTLKIKNGRIINIQCSNNNIVEELNELTKQDENSDRIGELGIGTNIGLEKLVGNLLQDEKFPGVHIAIGHGYPEKTGAPRDSITHIDCVLQKTTIEFDGKVIMKEGKYII